jgi:TctA family transporter
MSEGDLMVIFSSDLANIMWVLLVISLFVPYLLQRRRTRAAALAPPSMTDC